MSLPLVVLTIVLGSFQSGTTLLPAFLSFVVVGALVAIRRPGNSVGWLLLATGFIVLFAISCQAFAAYALFERPGVLRGGALATWLGEVPWGPIWTLFALLLLLFPTGRPPSPWWRWLVWLGSVNAAVLTISSAVVLWPLRGPALLGETEPSTGLGSAVMLAGFAVTGLTLVAAAASLVVRFVRARADERQQLKWIAYVVAFVPAVVALIVFREASAVESRLLEVAESALATVVLLGMPVAMGIAILRYRLYDIDRIVSRTVAYAALTALLAGLYVAGVFVLRTMLAPVTGESDIAVAGSTLLVAAAFGPVRRRIQGIVDRRFNRARYDAARTVEAFSARLRDAVDLDQLSSELRAVVDQTVQPTSVKLWLRGVPSSPSEAAAR